jgi:hypothetical protein
MVKGKPSVKCAWERDDVVSVVKEDDGVPMVKEDEAMPMVNQDKAPVDPFEIEMIGPFAS